MKLKQFLITLLVFLVSQTVYAYTWTDSKGLTWCFKLQNGGAVLYDPDNDSSNEWYPCVFSNTVAIPETLIIPSRVSVNDESYPVVGIGNSAFYYPDYERFNNVRNIVVPFGVTSIGMYAFYGCENLESITIPASVAYISSDAFLSFENMKTVYLMNTDPSSSVLSSLGPFSHSKPTLYVPAGSLDAYEAVSSYFKEVKENFVEFEYGDWKIKVINERAHTARILWYGGSPSWNEIVTTPQTATDPSTGTVYSITEIGEETSSGYYDVFSGYGDVDIDEPHSDPFDGLSGWTIIISRGIQTICTGAFSYLDNGTIYLPKSLLSTTIPSDIFQLCDEITVYIPYGFSLESTPSRTVKTNPNVSKDISFCDNNVKALCVTNWDTDNDGELSLYEAAAVTSLDEVFKENTEITSFDELQYFTGLTSIDGEAFLRCTKLRSIIIPKSVVNIHPLSFCYCSSLTSVVVDANNTVYNSRGGCNAIIHSSSNTLISGCKTTIIPSSVTRIGEHAFQGHNGLATIAIPATVTSIGAQAFCECDSLSSITIPNSVKSIDIFAFAYCSNLASVTIPNSVMSIGQCVFAGCNNLATIIVDENNTVYDSRDNCNAIIEKSSRTLIQGCKTTVIPSSVTSIGQNAFCDFESLTSITIPSLVTSIGNYAFENCSSLTSITISSLISSFGDGVFYGCSSLVSVVSLVPEPYSIDTNTFDGISSDCVLTVPAETRDAYIAAGWTEYVFKGGVVEEAAPSPPIAFADTNVKTLCVTNWDTNGDGELSYAEAAAVTDLGEVFKSNSNITSFDELQYFTGLSSIGQRAFFGCWGLTSVIIPSSVTSIGESAFFNCSRGLTSIAIPSSVTSIGPRAFYDCRCLTSVIISEGVTSIGYDAFSGCKSLTSIAIPSSVTSIGESAYGDCSSLSSITVDSNNTVYDSRNDCNAIIKKSSKTLIAGCKNTIIPSSVTSIGAHAFYFCDGLTSIAIPSSVTSIDEKAFISCSSLSSITVDSNNTVYDSRNDCNAIIKKSSETLIAGCKNTIIPSSVTSIGAHAFWGCDGLTSIAIPSSVTSIGEETFSFCDGLTSVIIPSSVTSIGPRAFFYCRGLTSVIISEGVTSIGYDAFWSCSSLTTVTIPSSVTSIGKGAFYSCDEVTTQVGKCL